MPETSTKVVDPVCGMAIDREVAIVVVHAGASYYFCDVACAETFRRRTRALAQGARPGSVGARPLTGPEARKEKRDGELAARGGCACRAHGCDCACSIHGR